MGGRVRVTAVSAEEAAGLLAARFVAPGSTGVQELLQLVVDAAAAAEATSSGIVTGQNAQQAQQQQQQQAWQGRSEGLAAALASVPERAAAVQLPALCPESFVPAVAGRLLDLLAAEGLSKAAQELQLEQGRAPRSTATAPPAAATAFAADVLARFCRRGHQQEVAAVLLACLRCDGGRVAPPAARLASEVVAAVQDSAALDRLLEAALKVAASTAPGNDSAEAQPTPPLDAAPAADPAARAAADALAALVPPAVWRARADARLQLTDKLLAQQQRRLLPLAALRGLLLFLRRQAPGGSPGEAAAASGVLADAAATVARVWGDRAAVQRLAPQHQAYLTAALCGGLQLLERRELERHPELLQLLLSGITARLDSPTQARALPISCLLPLLAAPLMRFCQGVRRC
jgi:hypothetical protein